MDYEIYSKIKKGNAKALHMLQDEHLKKSWFICYHLELCSCKGAPLLISAWRTSIEQIANAQTAPKDDFKEILYSNILWLHTNGIKEDVDFESIPVPQVAEKYRTFVKEIESLSNELRPIYLLSTYGNMSKNSIAQVLGISNEEVTEVLKRSSDHISQKGVILNKDTWARRIQLSAEFRNSSGSGFENIDIPIYLHTSLVHEINAIFNKPVLQDRKEQENMSAKTNGNVTKGPAKAVARKNAKKTKMIVISAVVVAAIILGVIFIPKLLANSTKQAASITTYNIESVSTAV